MTDKESLIDTENMKSIYIFVASNNYTNNLQGDLPFLRNTPNVFNPALNCDYL